MGNMSEIDLSRTVMCEVEECTRTFPETCGFTLRSRRIVLTAVPGIEWEVTGPTRHFCGERHMKEWLEQFGSSPVTAVS